MERELTCHRKRWEKVVVVAEEHKAAIEELRSKQGTLEEELVEKTRRVAELESLVEEVSY